MSVLRRVLSSRFDGERTFHDVLECGHRVEAPTRAARRYCYRCDAGESRVVPVLIEEPAPPPPFSCPHTRRAKSPKRVFIAAYPDGQLSAPELCACAFRELPPGTAVSSYVLERAPRKRAARRRS